MISESECVYDDVAVGDWIVDPGTGLGWSLVLRVRDQQSNPEQVSLLLSPSEDAASTWVHRYRKNVVTVRRAVDRGV